MEQLQALLSQYGVWGILAASVLVWTRQYWLPAVNKLVNRRTELPSEDADVTDVAGLHLLQARAKRSGCPKFAAAVREVELCFFNHADAEPAK